MPTETGNIELKTLTKEDKERLMREDLCTRCFQKPTRQGAAEKLIETDWILSVSSTPVWICSVFYFLRFDEH